jgi:hypothetical protein
VNTRLHDDKPVNAVGGGGGIRCFLGELYETHKLTVGYKMCRLSLLWQVVYIVTLKALVTSDNVNIM